MPRISTTTIVLVAALASMVHGQSSSRGNSGSIVYPSTPSIGSGSRVITPSPGSGSRYVPEQTGTVVMEERVVPSRTATAVPMVAPQTFESKLWNYFSRAKYRNWAPVPGQSDAMYEGQSPHGAHLKMYLNRTAAGSPKKLPHGSIIIKENYGADKKTLMAITAMYKTKGYSPSSGDWYWVKYNPDGTVAEKKSDTGVVTAKLAGRVKGCIACHDGADGGDFVFFND